MKKLSSYLIILFLTVFLNLKIYGQIVKKNDHSATRNLAQFALMINTVTGTGISGFLKYNGYGCWCGAGGNGRPVDDTDRCCQIHDRCYDAAEMYGCSPKVFNYYNYNATLGKTDCNDPQETCNYLICKCDKEATECFYKSLSTYKPDNLNNVNVSLECGKGYVKDLCYLTNLKKKFDSSTNNILKIKTIGDKKESQNKLNMEQLKTIENNSTVKNGKNYKRINCQPGYILNGPRTECVPCDPGKYTGYSGDYCEGSTCDGSYCPRCPNGYVCPCNGTSKPILCEAGTISNGKRDLCVPCNPGKYTRYSGDYCEGSTCDGSYCPRCPNGYVCPNAGTASPVLCKPGTISNGPRTECVPCNPGKYTGYSGDYCEGSTCDGSFCPRCPNGYVCPNAGTASPVLCPTPTFPNSDRTICISRTQK